MIGKTEKGKDEKENALRWGKGEEGKCYIV